jgi:competence ComEA-like helix-hairpin-helix protein
MRIVFAGLLIVLVGSIVGKAAGRSVESASVEAAQAKPAIKDLTAKEEEERAAVVEELMDRACRMCHPIENVTRLRRTVREWADVLTTMQGRGANATEDEFEAIHWYLNRYVGVVRVNTATVDELAAVLGLKAKEAQAIVDYRKANGNIADLAALMKVEGIDKTKIEEQPDALRFQ